MKSKGPSKKASSSFDTDPAALQPYGVNVNDLVTTSLGLTATVLGVKYAIKDDKNSGALWVQYKGGYKAPVDKDGYEAPSLVLRFLPLIRSLQVSSLVLYFRYERQSEGSHVWREISQHHKTLQSNEEMREKIQELNQRFRAGLLGEPKKNK